MTIGEPEGEALAARLQVPPPEHFKRPENRFRKTRQISNSKPGFDSIEAGF